MNISRNQWSSWETRINMSSILLESNIKHEIVIKNKIKYEYTDLISS